MLKNLTKKRNNQQNDVEAIRVVYLKSLNNLPVTMKFMKNGGIYFEYVTGDYDEEEIQSQLTKFIDTVMDEE